MKKIKWKKMGFTVRVNEEKTNYKNLSFDILIEIRLRNSKFEILVVYISGMFGALLYMAQRPGH